MQFRSASLSDRPNCLVLCNVRVSLALRDLERNREAACSVREEEVECVQRADVVQEPVVPLRPAQEHHEHVQAPQHLHHPGEGKISLRGEENEVSDLPGINPVQKSLLFSSILPLSPV